VHSVQSSDPPNVDLVRRLYEAFAERDLEGMMAVTSPDLEWFPVQTASMVQRSGPYRGHEGLRTYFADVDRVWRQLDIIPRDFRDLGDRVLVLGRVYGRGAGGYISDSPAGWLWKVEHGAIKWGRVYLSRAEALQAAGFEE
jgi:ketosteroid isomerase-like protein